MKFVSFFNAHKKDYTMLNVQAAGSISTDDAKPNKQQQSQAVVDFLEFMNKEPAELLREMFLEKLNHTEESLEAMPPEERKRIEDKIQAMIEEHMEEKVTKAAGDKAAEAVGGESEKVSELPANEKDLAEKKRQMMAMLLNL